MRVRLYAFSLVKILTIPALQNSWNEYQRGLWFQISVWHNLCCTMWWKLVQLKRWVIICDEPEVFFQKQEIHRPSSLSELRIFNVSKVVWNISSSFTIFELSVGKTMKINEIIRSSWSFNRMYEILLCVNIKVFFSRRLSCPFDHKWPLNKQTPEGKNYKSQIFHSWWLPVPLRSTPIIVIVFSKSFKLWKCVE